MTRVTHRSAFLAALFLIGLKSFLPSGAEAKQPPASLTSHEIQTMGEGVFPDATSYPVFGADELRRMGLELRDGQNATLMRSGAVPLHFILTQVDQAPAELTAHGLGAGSVLNAAINSKKLAALAKPRGTDIFSIWVDSFGSGQALLPTRLGSFGPKAGFAYAPTGASVKVKLHEGWHLFGCQHNPEASEPPGASSWPTAVGFLAANGTCDAVSYCSLPEPILSGPGMTYDGVVYGDVDHNNAAQARRAAGWLAAYNPLPPISIEKGECREDVDSACLQGMQVQVQWASAVKIASEASSFDGFARKASSNGKTATFQIASESLQATLVTRTIHVGHRTVTVTDLTLISTAAPFVRRVIITPPLGQTKVWQTEIGEALNLLIPAVF